MDGVGFDWVGGLDDCDEVADGIEGGAGGGVVPLMQ